jgi:hypothetical protein
VVGPLGLDRPDDLQREPDSLLEPATVSVVTLVGERGEELVHQVAVGEVELEHAEAREHGAAGGGGECTDDRGDVLLGHRPRGEGSLGEGDRARGDGLPAAGRDRHAGAALPGNRGARLPSGVGQLHARDGAPLLEEAHDARQELDVVVLPQTEVARADPPPRLDRRCLGHHQPRASHRARAEVHQMPVVGETVLGTVLAHRRDADAIGQRDGAHGERFEEVGHGAES